MIDFDLISFYFFKFKANLNSPVYTGLIKLYLFKI
ncbi:hypothetical protein SASC598J21_012760 [Snodgrassella alvi SCGC AB-598-J21]|uniref:Uncharacterized protein n=1 Tax=Snodgrassella alvi SCGC AB-598-J21 TaxID=1385367 RepID=A0A074VAP1_9NEIS|nr:hypothetical protein SASC598J21_012760 [Snodgrassella alvi SCGC AB-598-J21]